MVSAWNWDTKRLSQSPGAQPCDLGQAIDFLKALVVVGNLIYNLFKRALWNTVWVCGFILFKAVVLNWREFCPCPSPPPAGDIWQYLEPFWIVITGGGWHWQLGERDRGRYSVSQPMTHRESSPHLPTTNYPDPNCRGWEISIQRLVDTNYLCCTF